MHHAVLPETPHESEAVRDRPRAGQRTRSFDLGQPWNSNEKPAPQHQCLSARERRREGRRSKSVDINKEIGATPHNTRHGFARMRDLAPLHSPRVPSLSDMLGALARAPQPPDSPRPAGLSPRVSPRGLTASSIVRPDPGFVRPHVMDFVDTEQEQREIVVRMHNKWELELRFKQGPAEAELDALVQRSAASTSSGATGPARGPASFDAVLRQRFPKANDAEIDHMQGCAQAHRHNKTTSKASAHTDDSLKPASHIGSDQLTKRRHSFSNMFLLNGHGPKHKAEQKVEVAAEAPPPPPVPPAEAAKAQATSTALEFAEYGALAHHRELKLQTSQHRPLSRMPSRDIPLEDLLSARPESLPSPSIFRKQLPSVPEPIAAGT
uniref:Uncharacterized protein n=1 Tax=Prymnesium polylepis TaxID=72548 RepID=A0A7S4MSD8_9EUKA